MALRFREFRCSKITMLKHVLELKLELEWPAQSPNPQPY